MGKRTVFPDGDSEKIDRKRLKLRQNGSIGSADGTKQSEVLGIQTTRELRSLLIFQQDAGPRLRHNIEKFKEFLETIAYSTESEERSANRAVLLDYMKSVTPADDGGTGSLSEVIQTWNYAAQVNNDGLLSAVPTVLALLLKTISDMIDFHSVGVQLCKTLLQDDQVKLIHRGLSANKSKEHLISPCLRLLTEIVSFDGGVCARQVYSQKNFTFKRLDTLLAMRSPAGKPLARCSVRSHAIRYLLANIRFQNKSTKSDLLSQSRIVRTMFQYIKDDSPDLIISLLDVVKRNIVFDEALSRPAKSRLLTDSTLLSVVGLFSYERPKEDEQKSIPDIASAFLMSVCTAIDMGVLVKQHGWYPTASGSMTVDAQSLDSQQESVNHTSRSHYTDNVPVKNTTLASFLQGLRPHANRREMELVLAIFRVAPELVADYFLRRKTFSFDPKLSATWIGYSAFVLSVIQLPIPEPQLALGAATTRPPPNSIIMESILPLPLNQKTLTKCLNQSHALIKFVSLRVLRAAFQKLDRIISLLASSPHPQWRQATPTLVAYFSQRCPELKHTIAAFRSCSADKKFLNESISGLLEMYYRLTPQLAVQETFDISIALTDALSIAESKGLRALNADLATMQNLNLPHLLEIACRSSSMRWWQKPDNMLLSPFTSILRKYACNPEHEYENIQALLQSIVGEQSILQQATSKSSFSSLIATLRDQDSWSACERLYLFLDDCILRLIRRPIKYTGDLEDYLSTNPTHISSDSRHISPLLMAIVEQWYFCERVGKNSDVLNIATWIGRFIEASWQIGEDEQTLQSVKEQLRSCSTHESSSSVFKGILEAPKQLHPTSNREPITNVEDDIEDDSSTLLGSVAESLKESLEEALRPLPEPTNHPGLHRWMKKDISDAVEDGLVGELISCLYSEHEEIRRQALLNIKLLMSKLETSSYSKWNQMYLLLGEVVESAKDVVTIEPLPAFTAAIAIRGISVLGNPLHLMYVKFNQFLNKGPVWNMKKLPAQWIDQTFLQMPEIDDGHYNEIEWVIDTLIEGLRTPADLDIYRRCNVFERILSLSTSPILLKSCEDKMLRLLYRCTLIGGSSTLSTRCGVLGWITSRLARGSSDEVMLKCLEVQIRRTLGNLNVSRWKNDSVDLLERHSNIGTYQ